MQSTSAMIDEKKLNLKEEIFLRDLNQFHSKMSLKLKQLKELPLEIFTQRLSVGSQRVPEKDEDYYRRASSILVKIIEHPSGINKISKHYGRMKKSRSKPPKRYCAKRSLVKKYLLYLKTLDLVSYKDSKGFYTNSKGKELIKSCL